MNRDLGKRRADVIELHQPPSSSMLAIQTALVECIDATLSEIRRCHLPIDTEELQMENVMHRSFDVSIRRQLEPVWHRLGPNTRQLVGDLSTLRHLLHYLLSYDAVNFYTVLESIIASNTGQDGSKQQMPQWLMCPAADMLFREARARLWTGEIQRGLPYKKSRNTFVPNGIELVLEEPPKWRLLLEILNEIEQSIYANENTVEDGARNTILIMTSSDRSVTQLRSLLSRNEGLDSEHPGRKVMLTNLHDFFRWKHNLGKTHPTGARHDMTPREKQKEQPKISEALRQKDVLPRSGAPAHKRRRIRGGIMMPAQTHEDLRLTNTVEQETDILAQTEINPVPDVEILSASKVSADDTIAEAKELPNYFGVIDADNIVVVRKYGRDDDNMLQELRPRYLIMYEPNAAFIRQIEVYRSIEEVQLQVYFMMYTDSIEEHMYLGSLRREKDAFEKLIRQKGSMALPLTAENEPTEEDSDQRFLRTINTRVAGAQRVATNKIPTVVVDMREFRSSLPSLLHAAGLKVIPCTLQVGDYVISSEMCVERKSISDLIQSLTSGRLCVDANGDIHNVR